MSEPHRQTPTATAACCESTVPAPRHPPRPRPQHDRAGARRPSGGPRFVHAVCPFHRRRISRKRPTVVRSTASHEPIQLSTPRYSPTNVEPALLFRLCRESLGRREFVGDGQALVTQPFPEEGDDSVERGAGRVTRLVNQVDGQHGVRPRTDAKRIARRRVDLDAFERVAKGASQRFETSGLGSPCRD